MSAPSRTFATMPCSSVATMGSVRRGRRGRDDLGAAGLLVAAGVPHREERAHERRQHRQPREDQEHDERALAGAGRKAAEQQDDGVGESGGEERGALLLGAVGLGDADERRVGEQRRCRRSTARAARQSRRMRWPSSARKRVIARFRPARRGRRRSAAGRAPRATAAGCAGPRRRAPPARGGADVTASLSTVNRDAPLVDGRRRGRPRCRRRPRHPSPRTRPRCA